MEAKRRKLLFWSLIYAAALLLLFAVINLDSINAFLSSVLGVFRPVIIGLIVAYLCNPVFRFFERKTFSRIRIPGLRRGLSLFLTYLCVFLLIAGIILVLIPPLVTTVLDFFSDYENNLSGTVYRINDILSWINRQIPVGEDGLIPLLDPANISQQLSDYFEAHNIDTESIRKVLTLDNLTSIFSTVTSTVGFITDTIIGFFISLYLLSSKEKRYAQIMRFRIALFGDGTNEMISRISTAADESFGKFLRRRFLDAAIIGLAVFVVAHFLGVNNPQFLAALVGITDIVPVLGPVLGIIAVVLLLLLTQPYYILPLLLALIVIHILNRRLLSQKLFGNTTGVSALCVIIAIVVMGGLWGLAGFLLGVPIFATILELCDRYLERRLDTKGLSTDVRDYAAASYGGSFFRRMQEKPRRAAEAPDASGGTTGISDVEQFQLDTYALARKHHIFSENSEEALARFAAEETLLITAAKLEKANAVADCPDGDTPAKDGTASASEDASSDINATT